ncbi:MAG: bifunctional oligoribonuclease/PAP phosphatase NrnA [Candidatus Brocadiae bacterium]|nr:bifunctional oligoribonuclease/PAP phosphatase NrnA [Candidatus Brocadiia bacterium]
MTHPRDDAPADPAGLRAAIEELRRGRRFLVVTHARPDGDAIGSALALAHLLRGEGKEAECVVDAGTPPDLAFLPGSAAIGGTPAAARPPYDAVLIVDAAGLDRIEGMRDAVPTGARIVNIDHHASNTRFGAVNWIEPSWGSTGEMIGALAREAGWRLTREIAVCLYVAIVTDTGRFMFSSTRPATHELAAELQRHGVDPGAINREIWGSNSLAELRLHAETIRAIRTDPTGRIAWVVLTQKMFEDAGITPTESQNYVSLVKSIRGVEVAILLRPLSAREVKLSVRSEPSCDAAALCARFGGGGHLRAAGATMQMSLEEAEVAAVAAARDALGTG